MTKGVSRKIKSLLSLLDDENESVAVEAMAELLFLENELGDTLAVLQDDGNPLVRKRIHQLQAAITIRRRRRNFSRLLAATKINLIDGLIEVHLQWFDNDSKPGLEKLWADFAAEGAKYQVNTLEQLSYFMRKRGLSAAPETTMQPENYCIGTVLEANYGSAAILAGIAMELAAAAGLELKLVRLMGEFALLDGEGQMLVPHQDWQIITGGRIQDCDFWDRRTLLKFASMTLFSQAVNSDSFRYIQTIAQALSGVPDGELPETLPYPYCPAEEPEELPPDGAPPDGKE